MQQLDHGSVQAIDAAWQRSVTIADDALSPTLAKGAVVDVDCDDHGLVDGGIYAVHDGDALTLWLYLEGFAGQGPMIGGRRVATLSSIAGTFRCQGPLMANRLEVVGRVVEPASSASAGLSAIEAMRIEREGLLQALEDARLTLHRDAEVAAKTGASPPAARLEGATIADLAQHFEEAMRDDRFARHFALEQRLDAIGSRLMLVEEQIADAEARTLADVQTKLQLLWDLHYAPFPALHDDLGGRVIASALRGFEARAGNVAAGDALA